MTDAVNSSGVVLSVVVCSRNRASQLKESLDTFLQLSCKKPWEFVVVDNGSTDETQSVIAEFGRKFQGRLITRICTKVGTSNSRNCGVQACSGEIVAFTDDDCYPANDWLDEILLCFERDSRIGAIGGRVLLFDAADYPMTIKESSLPEEYHPGDFIAAGSIHGANFAFRRAAIESTGGFDPLLGGGTPFAGEDIDLIARVCASGWVCVYDPAPMVYHHHRRRDRDVIRRLSWFYDYGRGAYHVKCLHNPILAHSYKKTLIKQFLRNQIGSNVRELLGGLHYLLQSAIENHPHSR